MYRALPNHLHLSQDDRGLHFVLDGHEVDERTFDSAYGKRQAEEGSEFRASDITLPGFGPYSVADWDEAGIAAGIIPVEDAILPRAVQSPYNELLRNRHILSGEIALMFDIYSAPQSLEDLDRAYATARRIDRAVRATGTQLTESAERRLALVLASAAETERQAQSDRRFSKHVVAMALGCLCAVAYLVHIRSEIAGPVILAAVILAAGTSSRWLFREAGAARRDTRTPIDQSTGEKI